MFSQIKHSAIFSHCIHILFSSGITPDKENYQYLCDFVNRQFFSFPTTQSLFFCEVLKIFFKEFQLAPIPFKFLKLRRFLHFWPFPLSDCLIFYPPQRKDLPQRFCLQKISESALVYIRFCLRIVP